MTRMDVQLHGAFEEILVKFSDLLSNNVIEQIEENIKIDRINQVLSQGICDFQKKEPDYWRLRIVRFLRQEIEVTLRSSLYEIANLKFQQEESPWLNDTTSSDCLSDISHDIQKSIEYQVLIKEIDSKLEEKMFQLVKWVKENEKEFVSTTIDRAGSCVDVEAQKDMKAPFLEALWKKLDIFVKDLEEDMEQQENPEIEEDHGGNVYESISLDELNLFDDSNSMEENSTLSYEDIPILIQNLVHSKMTERHKALEALGQVSILELIHSAASCFNTLCFNLMMLFLDPTISIHEKAMIFMYNILQEIEEPYQFAVIYSSLIDFIVQNASSISTTSTSTSKKKPNTCITSPIDLRIINIYRFFHLLLMRLPDHWIYLQPEMLTRFFHGTFQLVFYQIGPNENGYYSFSQILSSLDPCSNWFSKWLLKCGGSLQDHLLLSLQESHFLEEILVRIAEFQPFTWTFPSSYEKWLYKVLLLIMETKAGRMTVYNVWDQVIEKGERYSSAMANKNNNIQLEKIDEIKLESNVEWNDKLFHRVFPVPIVSNTICNADEEEDKDKDVKDKAATDTHDEKSTSNMTDFFTGIFQVFLVFFFLDKKKQSVSSPEKKWIKASSSAFVHEISQDFLLQQLLPLFQETLSFVHKCPPFSSNHHFPKEKEEKEEEEQQQEKKKMFFPFNPFQKKIRAIFSGPIWFKKFLKTCLIQQKINMGGVVFYKKIVFILENWIVPCLLGIINKKKKSNGFLIEKEIALIGEILCFLIMENHLQDKEQQDVSYLSKAFSILKCLFFSIPTHSSFFLLLIKKLKETLLSHDQTTLRNRNTTENLMMEFLIDLCHSSRGLEFVLTERNLEEKLVEFILSKSQKEKFGVILKFQLPLLQIISVSFRGAQILFKACKIQKDFQKMIILLGHDLDFTLVLDSISRKSSEEEEEEEKEISFQLREVMFFFQWFLSILCTPFGPQSIIHEPFWKEFITQWLAIHHTKRCWFSCAKEDFCCLNLQMLLCLVSSFRGRFEMNKIYTSSNTSTLSNFSSSEEEQTTASIVTLCGTFESKINKIWKHFMVEPATFPLPLEDEYRPKLNKHSHPASNSQNSGSKPSLLASIERLSSSIIESINQSTNSSSLDFAFITSNAWDIVDEVGNLGQPWEHHHLVEPREIGQNLNTKWIDGSKYISEIHKMLAEVMCRLIFSGKSKLEAIAFDGAIDPHPVPHSSVEHHLGPEDRIFLNDIYTSTASTLEIESMPTILLQIMKKFGYEAKSCFVLSLLLIFGNSRNDKEILRFLTICHTSAIGPFLWISSGKESYQEEIWKFLRISEVVEHVLRCEDPRLLTMLHSSGISVFSLVERWYSQNFWGILPWKEILCYQLMVFIYGVDFIVYMAVALIHHLEPTLKQAITSRRPAKDLLLTDCYTSFGLGSWRKMIIQLRIEYHEVIMKTMKVTEKKKV